MISTERIPSLARGTAFVINNVGEKPDRSLRRLDLRCHCGPWGSCCYQGEPSLDYVLRKGGLRAERGNRVPSLCRTCEFRSVHQSPGAPSEGKAVSIPASSHGEGPGMCPPVWLFYQVCPFAIFMVDGNLLPLAITRKPASHIHHRRKRTWLDSALDCLLQLPLVAVEQLPI